MSMVKGVAVGMIAGACLGYAGKTAADENPKIRKKISRAKHTMGDVAAMSLHNPGCLYELLGINAGPLIDHAWGTESTRMADIKSYRPTARSLSSGQVLSRPYKYHEALLIFTEMSV